MRPFFFGKDIALLNCVREILFCESNMKNSQGFTLIELMIVIAIIGILAIFAIPAYQDYVVRTQAGEGYSLAIGYKSTVGDIFLDEGTFTNVNNGYLGVPPAGSLVGHYTSAIEVSAGIMTVHFGNDASAFLVGQTVRVSPVDQGGSITWQCSFSGLQRHTPKACRN